MTYTGTWQPPAASQNSPISPSIAEFRRRSLPSHIVEKEAVTMVTEKGSLPDDEQPQQARLSFWQRHFYRPAQSNEVDEQTPQAHRFSFLSRGFLISAAVLCLVLIAILCAVLATFYEHRHQEDRTIRLTIKEAVFTNFPDPIIIKHDGLWYAMATNNGAGVLAAPQNHTAVDYGRSNVQIATSPDFNTWTLLDSQHDPLPKLGNWVKKGYKQDSPAVPLSNVWAPSLIQRPSDGKFVLYYSAAVENATRSHCVGAAISNTSSPAGPYEPLDTTITCPIEEGGAIDPTPFIDVDGAMYLAWKVDGNNAGHGGVCGNTVQPLVQTPIKLQKMDTDGVTPIGTATTILDRTDEDGPLVEAPVIVRSQEGIYFLFFSSGCTRTPSYDVKYAWAHNVTGPYTRAKEPLLKTGDLRLLAPGSVGIAEEDGSFKMAFHARVKTAYGRVRAMFTSTIAFNGTEVFLVQQSIPAS